MPVADHVVFTLMAFQTTSCAILTCRKLFIISNKNKTNTLRSSAFTRACCYPVTYKPIRAAIMAKAYFCIFHSLKLSYQSSFKSILSFHLQCRSPTLPGALYSFDNVFYCIRKPLLLKLSL